MPTFCELLILLSLATRLASQNSFGKAGDGNKISWTSDFSSGGGGPEMDLTTPDENQSLGELGDSYALFLKENFIKGSLFMAGEKWSTWCTFFPEGHVRGHYR